MEQNSDTFTLRFQPEAGEVKVMAEFSDEERLPVLLLYQAD